MPFIDDFECILKAEKHLTAHRICKILVEHWGGERIYIPKRFEPITPEDTPKVLINKGIPRSTAYNWVNRWKK